MNRDNHASVCSPIGLQKSYPRQGSEIIIKVSSVMPFTFNVIELGFEIINEKS